MKTCLACVFALGLIACGPSQQGGNPDAGGGGGGDGGGNDTCTGGQTRCQGQSYQTCTNGQFTTADTCVPPEFCSETSGCVACNPGVSFCVDNSVYECTAGGQRGDKVEDCAGGLQCSGGMCLDLCAEAEANASYIGCEYWAVDLDNAIEVNGLADPTFACLFDLAGGVELSGIRVCTDGSTTEGLCDPGDACPSAGFTCQVSDICGFDAQHSPFAIVVSNPQSFAVNVTLADGSGANQIVNVGAGQVQKLYPQMMGFADKSVDGSGITQQAYRITSEAPIVAYQFNPLDNEDVFSNDGSLLLPRTTFDSKYYAMSWPTLNRRHVTGFAAKNDYNGYIAVVSWKDGTEIRVTPSADVRLGPGFAPIMSGTPTTFTLDAFEVLNIEADNTPSNLEQDLSGTLIEAVDGVSSFGVLAGHEAIVIQNTSTSCCADHIEEMMFPASTWGKEYAIARSQSRGKNEPDLLRVMAQEDGTTITFNPTPSEGTCPTLAAGEFCDVKIMVDTEVSGGDKPILIGHYLLSVIEAAGDLGDPALALAVPTEQFRSTYTILVPSEYDQQYVSIVGQASGVVTIDNTDVSSQLTAFGANGYRAGRISVQAGQHKIDCPGGCGIEVYGYSDAVSYLFAGGLDLEQIVID